MAKSKSTTKEGKPHDAVELVKRRWQEIDRGAIFLAALLASSIFIAYLPTLRGGFVWDDRAIPENVLLHSPDGLAKIWTQPSLNVREHHYWPMAYTTFWAEHQLWGDRPFGYHLVNILIHVLNALLLWALLRRLGIPGAWVAAAAFGLHPTRVESVAWIVERKDLLAAAFYFLSFLAYARFDASRSRWLYAASFLLFTLAMLSKSMALSLPLAMGLWLWWKRDRLTWRDLAPLILFAAVGMEMAAFDLMLYHAHPRLEFGLSALEKILVASRALWFYVEKFFWPAGLMTIYPRWEMDEGAFSTYLPPAFWTSALAALWLFRRRIGRGPFAATAFFVVTMAPVLGFIEFDFMRYAFVADRFQYIGAVGLVVLVCGVGARAARRFSPPVRQAGWIALGAVLLSLGTLTWRQALLYKDNETLFRHNVELNPEAWGAHHMLAYELQVQGHLEEAVEHYYTTIRLRPDYATALSNLGGALNMLHRFDGAIPHLRRALSLEPDSAATHNNLAIALGMTGDYEGSVHHFEITLRLDPDYPKARFNAVKARKSLLYQRHAPQAAS